MNKTRLLTQLVWTRAYSKVWKLVPTLTVTYVERLAIILILRACQLARRKYMKDGAIPHAHTIATREN